MSDWVLTVGTRSRLNRMRPTRATNANSNEYCCSIVRHNHEYGCERRQLLCSNLNSQFGMLAITGVGSAQSSSNLFPSTGQVGLSATYSVTSAAQTGTGPPQRKPIVCLPNAIESPPECCSTPSAAH